MFKINQDTVRTNTLTVSIEKIDRYEKIFQDISEVNAYAGYQVILPNGSTKYIRYDDVDLVGKSLHIISNNSIEFNVSKIWSRKSNSEELANPERIFQLLDSYVKHRGKDFEEKLYSLYAEARKKLDYSILQKTLRKSIEVVSPVIMNIINHIDTGALSEFVLTGGIVKPPKCLIKPWDPTAETNTNTRNRTYLDTDYMDLVIYSLMVKSVIPIIADFGYIHSDQFRDGHMEYIMFNNMLDIHPLSELPGMRKLLAFTKDFVITADMTEKVGVKPTKSLMISREISEDDVPTYVVAGVIVKRVSALLFLGDTDERNAVTMVNKANASVLKSDKSGGGLTKSRTLTRSGGGQDDSDDKESYADSILVESRLTILDEVSYNFYLGDLNRIFRDMGFDGYDKLEYYASIAEKAATELLDRNLSWGQDYLIDITLLEIMKPDRDGPNSVGGRYVNYQAKKNEVIAVFTIMCLLGYERLAILFIAKNIPSDGIATINASQSKVALSKNLRDELLKHYPLGKESGGRSSTITHPAIDSVSMLVNSFVGGRWVETVGSDFIVEVYGMYTSKLVIGDLFDQLVSYIITLRERKQNRRYTV
jgi:hypothetical protein